MGSLDHADVADPTFDEISKVLGSSPTAQETADQAKVEVPVPGACVQHAMHLQGTHDAFLAFLFAARIALTRCTARSASAFFRDLETDEQQADHPDMSPSAVNDLVGKIWQQLDEQYRCVLVLRAALGANVAQQAVSPHGGAGQAVRCHLTHRR